MKRTFFRTAVAFATAIILTASLTTARACQYCRMALEDPEAGRMITANHGGGFPLDGSFNQYQAAPVSADLKTAPATDSVVTSASALKAFVPAASVNAPLVVHCPVLPPPAAPAVVAVKASASNPAVNAAIAHRVDFCLLGLVAAGGVFCWRTRRAPGNAGEI